MLVNGVLIPGTLSSNPDEQDSKIRELIYENQLPVWKPIAYHVDLPTLEKRHESLGEHGLAVSVNLSHLLIISKPNTHYQTIYIDVDKAKEVTTANSKFECSAKKVDVLSTKEVLLTTLKKIRVQVLCKLGVGFSSLEDSIASIVEIPSVAKTVRSWMPISTPFSLIDYVCVLPFDGKITKIRLRNGMTEEYFNRILEEGLKV